MSNLTNQKTPQGTGNFQSNFTRKKNPSTGSTSRPQGKSKFSATAMPKSKSRFAQKSRGNPKGPVAVKRGPVNSYTSVCCSLPAVKPGCIKVDKKKALEQGLGTWRCSGCHKATKVTVSKFHAAEATVGNVTVTALVPAEYNADSIKVLAGMAPVVKHPEAYVPGVPVVQA
jgi:hypothetical protein